MEMNLTLGPGHQITARWDSFEIKTDKPVSQGGEGAAPTPFEYFLAGLGTCTAHYILGFCTTRDIPTDQMRLVLRLVTSEDGQETKAIQMELILPPEFPAKYEKAVVRAAAACRVKKTIMNPPEITLTTRRLED